MKKAIQAKSVMREAYDYDRNPATFSRGMVVGNTLYVSGTASIGEGGETLYKGDFASQVFRMFYNVTNVLKEGGMEWKDVVRTTIYLRDIDRDYEEFNKLRREFYDLNYSLNPYPASTCIEAKLCRSDLLCEMEAIAIK